MSRLDSRPNPNQTALPEVEDDVTAGDWWFYGTMVIGLICMGIVALVQSL